MILGLSFGCCYKFIKTKNYNDIITFYRENFPDINAIELIIPKKFLKQFELSKKNYEWLSNLKHISYHLLNQDCYFEEKRVIQKLPKIDYIVCHVDLHYKIPEWFLDMYYDKIIIENIVNDENYSFDYAKRICFDTSHAIETGGKYIHNFLSYYGNKIKQVHLSDYKKKNVHIPFYKESKMFEHIKGFIDLKKYSIIIESVCNNLNELKKEYKFIKDNI